MLVLIEKMSDSEEEFEGRLAERESPGFPKEGGAWSIISAVTLAAFGTSGSSALTPAGKPGHVSEARRAGEFEKRECLRAHYSSSSVQMDGKALSKGGFEKLECKIGFVFETAHHLKHFSSSFAGKNKI